MSSWNNEGGEAEAECAPTLGVFFCGAFVKAISSRVSAGGYCAHGRVSTGGQPPAPAHGL